MARLGANAFFAGIIGNDKLAEIAIVDYDPNSGSYLFTPIDVASGQTFYLEVSHLNANADQGFYYVSVGQPLTSGGETVSTGGGQGNNVYLPVVIK